jgi:hypothetical protein
VRKVAKWRVRVALAGRRRGTWAILCETRENRPERIVTKSLIHLSLKKLIGEQNTAEKNARRILCLAKGLTRHCLAISIQPDSLCRTWCSAHSSVGNTGPSVESMSGGINWCTR